MQKITTSLNKTENSKSKPTQNDQMQPTAETLKKIMNFAATYRAQKVGENQFIEMFLN